MASSVCVLSHTTSQQAESLSNSNIISEIGEEDFSKYSFLPIKYPVLIDYFERQAAVVWTTEEIDCLGDRDEWDKLDEGVREFIKFILFFFAQADGIVNENLIRNFKEETSEYKEASYFYASQEFIEVVHNKTYSMLIEAFIRDRDEKDKAFNAIAHYPSIRKIANWMFEWMDPSKPLTERVIAFACVEGIFFSSAFAAIYWIKRKNILKGLCKANEFIARDEALHTEFAVALYHVMTMKQQYHESGSKNSKIPKCHDLLSESRVHEIISSATDVSEEFTRNALRVDLVGMNADDMVSYVKCTANKLSESLGYSKLYNVDNPFNWMAVISLPNKSNFFETKVTEYARQTKSQFEWDLDTPF